MKVGVIKYVYDRFKNSDGVVLSVPRYSVFVGSGVTVETSSRGKAAAHQFWAKASSREGRMQAIRKATE